MKTKVVLLYLNGIALFNGFYTAYYKILILLKGHFTMKKTVQQLFFISVIHVRYVCSTCSTLKGSKNLLKNNYFRLLLVGTSYSTEQNQLLNWTKPVTHLDKTSYLPGQNQLLTWTKTSYSPGQNQLLTWTTTLWDSLPWLEKQSASDLFLNWTERYRHYCQAKELSYIS